jgi:hypothetical protein
MTNDLRSLLRTETEIRNEIAELERKMEWYEYASCLTFGQKIRRDELNKNWRFCQKELYHIELLEKPEAELNPEEKEAKYYLKDYLLKRKAA